MVVGHVQSGKTANYAGLICKAADAGYKLVVIIAGIHNILRNQTQLRIDESFVGRDSARLLSKKDDRFIGVGRFDQTRRPVTFTNSVKDFSKAMATSVGLPLQNLNEPAAFVIKKNSTTLKNLLEWLREHSARGGARTIDAPMLLIDDEADNASINIRHGKGEVSRINGQIRDLLHLFERSCYVGYTATPFANIFIDPDTDDEMLGEDLFPRNFIVSLDPPSNYFGPDRVFLHESENFIRHIDDNEEHLPLKHTIDFKIAALPQSLIDAIRTYMVGRAIRLARGHAGQHSSMLVNASRFMDVQRQLRNEVHNKLQAIKASVRVNGALAPSSALRDPEIAALHQVWEREYHDTEFDWPAIQKRLQEAVAPISIVEVNGRSPGTLNYADHAETGLIVIAVGGFSLSRGLTLEGLMISYFLRNSMMYDTLMQMGRWFGYRSAYEDLCRIWMPEEAEGWYAHVAESIEELRDELRSMEAASATPEEFGLKVRSHPDNLIVTARNKMGSGERVVVNIGLGNRFVETAILRRDEASLVANRAAVRRLAEQLAIAGSTLAGAEQVSSGWLLRNVPVDPILDFLAEFRNHEGSMLTAGDPIRRYIRDRASSKLASWDILFASVGSRGEDTLFDDSLGIPVNCQRRTAGNRSDQTTLRVTNKQRVASRGVEKTGLTDEQVASAEAEYQQKHPAGGGGADSGRAFNYPDHIYRQVRERPLLIVHLLKIDPEPGGKEYKEPVVAWSISFPKPETDEKREEYVVNTTWIRENYGDDVDEEEMGGDVDG
ncbi:MAG: Z1 domain-containing protein [Chloroflexi bacterium]|nr:Z1 domain-containing protein [Chloroflexota bacterium]